MCASVALDELEAVSRFLDLIPLTLRNSLHIPQEKYRKCLGATGTENIVSSWLYIYSASCSSCLV